MAKLGRLLDHCSWGNVLRDTIRNRFLWANKGVWELSLAAGALLKAAEVATARGASVWISSKSCIAQTEPLRGPWGVRAPAEHCHAGAGLIALFILCLRSEEPSRKWNTFVPQHPQTHYRWDWAQCSHNCFLLSNQCLYHTPLQCTVMTSLLSPDTTE